MAKKKSKKIEKETRKLIHAVSDMVKYQKKGKNQYKFKAKNKKAVKQIKKTCVHWIYRKGSEQPCCQPDVKNPGNWRCMVCHASFPINPLPPIQGQNGEQRSAYDTMCEDMLAVVNQIQFWAVKFGGDADDTKMFTHLKTDLPRFRKVAKQVQRRMDKRAKFEDGQRRNENGTMSHYAAYQYRP